MSNDYKVVPSSEVHPVPSTRKSPMKIILDSVEGDYWTMGNVAAHIGVHIETVRRACRSLDENNEQVLKAPSNAVRSGRVVIWLFNVEDVIEVENHFDSRGFGVRRIDPKKTLKEQTLENPTT